METKNFMWGKQLSVILALLASAFCFGTPIGWAALNGATSPGGKETMRPEPAAINPVRAQEMILSRPLSFIPNQGQASDQR